MTPLFHSALLSLSEVVPSFGAQHLGRLVILHGPQPLRTRVAADLAGRTGLRMARTPAVSKYIGEAEKNLSALLTAAQVANAILFLDEADDLFGRGAQPPGPSTESRRRFLARLMQARALVVLGLEDPNRVPPDLLHRSRVLAARDHWPPRT